MTKIQPINGSEVVTYRDSKSSCFDSSIGGDQTPASDSTATTLTADYGMGQER